MTTSTTNPQEKVCAYEYTVKRGDSFYLIAHRLGVPLRDLLDANSEINPARLMVGDVLCIPMEEDDAPEEPDVPDAPDEPAPPAKPPVESPDDTADDLPEDLDRPAQPESVPVQPNTPNCPPGTQRTVQSGETITDIQLESDVTLHALQSANPDANLDELTAGQVLCIPTESIPCPTDHTMILQSGDNIESLALRLDTSVGALLRANPCLAPSGFTEGVCIRIPGT